MSIIFTPDTTDQKDVIISIGDIVQISDYGTMKWLVCRGWYTYDRSRCYGWYFKSIPDNRILPESEVDMSSVTLLSSEGTTEIINCNCGCNGGNTSGGDNSNTGNGSNGGNNNGSDNNSGNDNSNNCQPPSFRPPHRPHKPPMFAPAPDIPGDGTFITVDTISERNVLGTPFTQDGKIVRVNNVRGEVKYYVWNAEALNWENWEVPSAGSGSSDAESLEELEKKVESLMSQVETISTKLELNWDMLNE